MNKLQDLSLSKVLPDSLKKDSFVVALAEALEIEIKEAYEEAATLSNLNDIENLPENLLDYLAHQKHVDFYEDYLHISEKRKLIKNAVAWHRKKGTKWAVEEIVNTFYANSEMKEWFQYDGNPHYFKIRIKDTTPNIQEIPKLIRMIDSSKRKSSVLEGIYFTEGGVSFQLTLEENGSIRIVPLIDFPTGFNMPGTRISIGANTTVERRIGLGVVNFASEVHCGETKAVSKGLGQTDKLNISAELESINGIHEANNIDFDLNISINAGALVDANFTTSVGSGVSILNRCGTFAVSKKNREVKEWRQ